MKLSHLSHVVAVAETGSLRAAGRLLNVAQPVITRSIREIENELGVALFERHQKGVRMTEIGEAFVHRADVVQSELRRALEEIEQMKGATKGEVSVALSTASTMSLMPTAVAAFRKKYPDVVLKIAESFFPPADVEILSGRVDFYVGPVTIDGVSSQFSVEKLFDNHRVVVARKGSRYSKARTLAELADAQWIRPALAERSIEGDFEILFSEHGFNQESIVMHARSALITLIAVANSDLLTILPKQWIEYEPTASMIAEIELDHAVPAMPICIVRRRDMPLTPIAEFFCDLMRRAGGHYAYRQEHPGDGLRKSA